MIGPEAMYDLLFNHEGRWDTPEQIQAIESFFVDLRDAGCFSEDVNAITYEDGNSLFFNGEAVLHPTGSWLITDIEREHARRRDRVRALPGRGRWSGPVLGQRPRFELGHLQPTASIPRKPAKFLDFLISPGVGGSLGGAGATLPLPVTTRHQHAGGVAAARDGDRGAQLGRGR